MRMKLCATSPSQIPSTCLLSGKVVKFSLPMVPAPPAPNAPRLKRLMLPQGELAHFYDGPEGIQYLAFLDLPLNTIRGNHYHRSKEEFFYLICGELLLVVQDLHSNQRATIDIKAGDLMMIPTGIAHAIQTRLAGHAIEFSPVRFDAADVYRFPLL